MQVIKKIIIYLLRAILWFFKNIEETKQFVVAVVFFCVGIYILSFPVLSLIDRVLITPVKIALYGKPIQQVKLLSWKKGYVLTSQENQELIYIINIAMQMVSDHKPVGKQGFFTTIKVDLDNYSSEASHLTYNKSIFNLTLLHYEHVQSAELNQYNHYGWNPGPGGGRYYLSDEEKERLHNAKAMVINRLRQQQKPWANASIWWVNNDQNIKIKDTDNIIPSWNEDTLKKDLNLTFIQEEKGLPSSYGGACIQGMYIYKWNKDPTVEVSFSSRCMDPKTSQEHYMISNLSGVFIKQTLEENPEIQHSKEQEKKENILQSLGINQ